MTLFLLQPIPVCVLTLYIVSVKRHEEASARLAVGLHNLGLQTLVADHCRLPQLTTVALPPALHGAPEVIHKHIHTLGAGCIDYCFCCSYHLPPCWLPISLLKGCVIIVRFFLLARISLIIFNGRQRSARASLKSSTLKSVVAWESSLAR